MPSIIVSLFVTGRHVYQWRQGDDVLYQSEDMTELYRYMIKHSG